MLFMLIPYINTIRVRYNLVVFINVSCDIKNMSFCLLSCLFDGRSAHTVTFGDVSGWLFVWKTSHHIRKPSNCSILYSIVGQFKPHGKGLV